MNQQLEKISQLNKRELIATMEILQNEASRITEEYTRRKNKQRDFAQEMRIDSINFIIMKLRNQLSNRIKEND